MTSILRSRLETDNFKFRRSRSLRLKNQYLKLLKIKLKNIFRMRIPGIKVKKALKMSEQWVRSELTPKLLPSTNF